MPICTNSPPSPTNGTILSVNRAVEKLLGQWRTVLIGRRFGGGRVTLSVHRDATRAVIHVRDTGPGVDPGLLQSIFEPFTQARQTLARTEGGLGLGLALVKGLVTLHEGDVAARNERPGPGADFVVTLPLAPAGKAAGPRTNAGAALRPPTRKRVLVVDDNRDAAETLAQIVEMLGHEAQVAYDGPTALALAAEDPPQLVLCDVGLPGMDGYEVARRLRTALGGAGVRLIALSGYAAPEDVEAAMKAGFNEHVAKPATSDTLAALLR
jgi:CheY-like chemotaxis protein